MSRYNAMTVAGKSVGPVGYGMMSLTNPFTPVELSTAISVLKTALEQGATLWNGSTHYGIPTRNSLHLMHEYFTEYPADSSRVCLTMKGAFNPHTGPDGSPQGIRAAVDEALKILPPSVKAIDTFQCGRVDPKVPIETTIQALAELVKEGKIGGVGLSEASAQTIRRAYAVYPVAVVEIELSLFTPDALENGIVEACRELGIPIIAYSPIGRGWLTGELRSLDDLPEKDFRRMLPRFQPENFGQNLKLVEAVDKIAKRKGVSTAQVALGWVCAHGAIPIPGSTKEARIMENCKPVELTEDDIVEMRKILETMPIAGQRYGGQHEAMLNG